MQYESPVTTHKAELRSGLCQIDMHGQLTWASTAWLSRSGGRESNQESMRARSLGGQVFGAAAAYFSVPALVTIPVLKTEGLREYSFF
jgi:hypothetical protein